MGDDVCVGLPELGIIIVQSYAIIPSIAGTTAANDVRLCKTRLILTLMLMLAKAKARRWTRQSRHSPAAGCCRKLAKDAQIGNSEGVPHNES